MQLKIKLIDNTLPPPRYYTQGSVGLDLVARTTVSINPKEIKFIPLNIVVQVPKGYFFLLACRSSLPIKKGLFVANSIGVIDQDYCGEEDEVLLMVYNFTEKKVVIERGERIAQGLLVKISQPEVKIVKKAKNKSRGGFGSTNK